MYELSGVYSEGVRSIACEGERCNGVYVFKSFDTPIKKRFNIMIIDDDRKNIALFKELLSLESDLKFSLSRWTRPHEALVALGSAAISPDIIMLDLVMPCVNGKMTLTELKNIASAQSIPVVIHSSMSTPQNIQAVRDLGAHAFFPKPLNAPLFAAFIRGQTLEGRE